MRAWLRAWDGWRLEVTEFRELDGEQVFALCRAGGRGKTSGVQVSAMGANLFRIRDGKGLATGQLLG